MPSLVPIRSYRGDVLHCDFGIVRSALNTDHQHMGYVLREGRPPPADSWRRFATEPVTGHRDGGGQTGPNRQ
jgi:hypothetical protein